MDQDKKDKVHVKYVFFMRLLKACAARCLARYWHGQPIYRIQANSFLLVALVPMSILGLHLYQTAWDNAWREVQEKTPVAGPESGLPHPYLFPGPQGHVKPDCLPFSPQICLKDKTAAAKLV